MSGRAWSRIGAVLFVLAGAALAWFALPPRPEPSPPFVTVPAVPPAPPVAPAPTPAPPAVGSAVPQAPDAGAATAAPAAIVATPPERARGERGTAYLIRIFQTSRDFRIRVPVAISLGRVGSPPAIAALVAALSDPHPAVRDAAAGALGRHGGAPVLPALRGALATERDVNVRHSLSAAIARIDTAGEAPALAPRGWGARYYVAVGAPSAARTDVTASQLAQVELAVRSAVGGLAGVRLAPPREGANTSRAVLEGSTIEGYHLDIAVSAFERDGRGNAHATISIMVATLPGRDLRAVVKGSAAVESIGDPDRAATNVLEGAARSAVRQLPATFERAAR